MNALSIVRLNRYPIKGLSAEPIQTVTLRAGEGIPGDRLFGFARYNSGFDVQNPQPLPKDRFVVLLNEAALAGIQTNFDIETQVLAIKANGKTRSFNMLAAEDRRNASNFLSSVIGLKDPEPPNFVSSAPHRFTDVSVVSPKMMNAISVLNLASVGKLGEKLNAEIHPARFRANLEIDGLTSFSELDAVGSVFRFGDVELKILSRTKRCAATEVNPDTAERDLKIPYLIRKLMGHTDMGVYVEVVKGGTLRVGQTGEMLS
ncbi:MULTISPECIES: MOSC domain-containing protein [unclassified Ruegeria]|uniref:MOSC domain-containing protein n=1 Tax=unclassified Ruegeria TaxID=2625375 RepID=UPI001489FFCA|nr:MULTISPECIES: MOSC domain-containing protein [unclassified Ruegeria]NOD61889.1 MOSC domain-containing protein [Ruegeria sp. HKCCD6109]